MLIFLRVIPQVFFFFFFLQLNITTTIAVVFPLLDTGENKNQSTNYHPCFLNFTSVQSLSGVRPFVTPRTATCQASLSFTIFWGLLKLISIESVMPSNHLILCCPLLLLSSIFPRIRVFSNESALHIRWSKYWN